MYVYVRSNPGRFTVGFFDPTGQWHTDNDYDTREKAAFRVAWLNEGATPWWKNGGAWRGCDND